MAETKSLAERIDKLDSRILYIVIFLSVGYVILNPIGLPLTISDSVQSAYDFIDDLPEGSIVLCGFETGAGGYPSQGPQMGAYVRHMMDRNIKLVFVSGFIDGPTVVTTKLFPDLKIAESKTYGEDYVLLGYISGGPTGMAAFGTNIRNILPTDYYNTPIDDIPMMDGVETVADFDLVICCSQGSPGWQDYLKQYVEVHGTPLICGTLGSAPEMVPFYQSGQIVGYTPDLRGAAEYEVISGHPGYAVTSLDAMSIYHVILLVFLVIGNVAFAVMRIQNKEAS